MTVEKCVGSSSNVGCRKSMGSCCCPLCGKSTVFQLFNPGKQGLPCLLKKLGAVQFSIFSVQLVFNHLNITILLSEILVWQYVTQKSTN